MENVVLYNAWDHPNAKCDNTYLNYDLNHFSCIDYFMVSGNIYSKVAKCSVWDQSINPSYHHPVLITVLVDSCNVTKDTDVSGNDMQVPAHASVQNQPVINWNLLSSDNIINYQVLLDSLLSDIVILPHIHTCRDVNCSNIAHTAYIDKYCDEIVDKCIKAGLSAFPLYKSNPDYRNKHRLPEWNTLIKPLRQSSIFWHQLWQACGKPNEGQVAAIMRTTRAKYHRVIKEVKKHIKDRKNNELITQLCCKDYKAFWSNIRNMSRTSNIFTENIDGKSNEREICSLLENKYKDILQSTPTDKKVLENLAHSFETSCNEDMDNFYVSADDIRNIIVKLNKNKGDGGIGYNSNHLIFGSQSLFQHIGNLIELMVSHGYTPSLMSQSHIVSIPKDKRGNLQSSDNYRGISLSNALCKVVDLWVLSKCSHLLLSSDMQYAFKINHYTVMCTTMLKEIISYYNSNHSDVYACLVDASKAYDKLNFGKLFQILIDRGIPNLIIRSKSLKQSV